MISNKKPPMYNYNLCHRGRCCVRSRTWRSSADKPAGPIPPWVASGNKGVGLDGYWFHKKNQLLLYTPKKEFWEEPQDYLNNHHSTNSSCNMCSPWRGLFSKRSNPANKLIKVDIHITETCSLRRKSINQYVPKRWLFINERNYCMQEIA